MTIRKTFKAEMAHRVRNAYTTRCQGLHGHSYIFEIFLNGETQDNAEMLCDFKLVKEQLDGFLDSFDHTLVIDSRDNFLVKIAKELNPRYMIIPYNPTAEQMARHIYYQAIQLVDNIQKVIVHETKTGYAEFAGDDNIKIDIDSVIYSEEIKWK